MHTNDHLDGRDGPGTFVYMHQRCHCDTSMLARATAAVAMVAMEAVAETEVASMAAEARLAAAQRWRRRQK